MTEVKPGGGGILVQRLELAEDELAHTITSVAKDNWVFEIYGEE